MRISLCVKPSSHSLCLCRWRQHETALLRSCLCVRLCIPGNSTVAVSQLQGQVFGLVGPRHVVPQHLPHWRVDAVRVWKPLGRSVPSLPPPHPDVKTPPVCVTKQSFSCIIHAWRRTDALPVLCHTGGSRGLVQGRLWRRDGVLAVSCSQEGVLRVKAVAEPSKL